MARLLLLAALSVLLGVSLATYDPLDWSRLVAFGVLHAPVTNSCGVAGTAASHLLVSLFGGIAAWGVVLLALVLGAAGVWPALERRLFPLMTGIVAVLLLLSMGLAFLNSSAPDPARSGGSVGVWLAALGTQFLGTAGTSVFLILAALMLVVAAFGGVIRRIRLPSLRLNRVRHTRSPSRATRQRPITAEPDEPTPVPEPPLQLRQPAEKNRTPGAARNLWPYKLPQTSILRSDGTAGQVADAKEVESRKKKLEHALASFGIDASVVRAVPGPVITRYEVEPAPGVKVARIAALSHDLARALKALLIRVVAPIPGTEVVGIEAPNRKLNVVRLGDIVRSPDFQGALSPLALPLGKDTVGESVVLDLSTLPHLLIGGTTGSGKSSCIHSFICGLLMRVTPNTVRLILIDPKRVELIGYEGIPHLLHPVVTDPKVALRILGWAVQEMEQRYSILSDKGLRDIRSMHAEYPDNGNQMPYIVIIIDELADLMMSAPGEIEGAVIRLAQKARAVGIHLVVATQRPSKEIVTGVLKSNFPGRIAFQVMQKVNSNIILDSPGAEKLLGRGDMLFLPPGAPAPRRVHGAYVSPQEVSRVVEFWKVQQEAEAGDEQESLARLTPEELERDDLDDPLWEEAARLVILNNQGSTSLIQRRLKVGYARAGRLMDILENKGIVGPAQGSKPREVLVDASWLEAEEVGSGSTR
jgi:S-DNA-T family DNA segregation ATPase FtsK/SpoIIIE